MQLRFRNPERAARLATIITLGVMVVWGLVSVVFEVRPFWVDEWRIIYNLKFKTPAELWGKLAFMQQFPRTWLWAIKHFTAAQDYSYFSLRLPSFLIALMAIYATYSLATRIYGKESYLRFILVLMLVSCGTFTEYFVQTKQYTMDLFLCVVAVWQLVSLLQIPHQKPHLATYLLLCGSMLLAPYFSYTYPLTIAPVYVVLLFQNIAWWRSVSDAKARIMVIMRQWFPLFLCTFSITLFYMVDVNQVTADREMNGYWAHLMMRGGFDIMAFLTHCFHMFAQAGAGFLFWWLFGLTGTAAFFYSCFVSVQSLRQQRSDTQSLVLLYSVVLILLVFVLHAIGKLPLGEPRLNAFAIPACAIMIICLLEKMNSMNKLKMFTGILSFLLIAGPAGNIYSTVAASFTDSKYAQRMQIYRATEKALATAREQNLPVFITPGVAYPYENTENLPSHSTVPGDWVLTTFPEYRVGQSGMVYPIADTSAQSISNVGDLPANVSKAMIGDGINYYIADIRKVE